VGENLEKRRKEAMIKNKALAFLAIILFLPILACKILSTERMPPATVLPGIPGATAQPPSIATAVIPSATSVQQTTPPPDVVATWFYQDKQIKSMVYYAFVVENPNPNLALANLQFQVVAYDASETILGTNTVDIGMIFPGERLAVSGFGPNVPESSTVTRIGVQISRSAEARISEQRGSPFTTEKVTYFSGQAYSRVTGIIRNTLNTDISNLTVTAIAYDERGNIIGAGKSWLDSLPANGYNAAVVDLQIVGEPAKVELYPFLTSSVIEEPSQTIEALRVASVGASMDQYNQGFWGMIVENTGTKAPSNSRYTMIAYDENGIVLVTTTGFIGLIFPGERLGVSGYLNLPEGTRLGKVEARIYSGVIDYNSWGILKAGITTNPLTAEQATYLPGEYGGRVTGIVKNSYDKDLQNIQVTAIAYDASGAIIGGWSTYVSSVPANGQVAIDIPVNCPATPVEIEVYPTLTVPGQ
jgi:hypothetical protein